MDKDDYVNEIKKGLQDLPDSDEWMEELESPISQAFAHYLNEGKTEKEAMMRIWHEVGSPADIIHSFKKETSVSPRGFLLFHFFCNLSLFAAGAALTIIHVWSVHPLVKAVWSGISVSVWLILGGYLLYWMFIGYQAGREFGLSGKRLVHYTVSVSMAPNVCFMLVFLFGLVPADLFQSMLTPGFVLACAVATMLFPACSRLGCYLGRRRLAKFLSPIYIELLHTERKVIKMKIQSFLYGLIVHIAIFFFVVFGMFAAMAAAVLPAFLFDWLPDAFFMFFGVFLMLFCMRLAGFGLRNLRLIKSCDGLIFKSVRWCRWF